MKAEVVERVRSILERQRVELAAFKERCGAAVGLSVCPACGSLIPSAEIVDHARSYADGAHLAVEVMLT